MVKIYADLIKQGAGNWTIERVPERWRADVKEILNI